VLKDIILEKRGLILMVGATGSGKSTTLAAMLDFRNGQKTGHIFTLEDPVEFIFQNKKSIVNQREVGTDTLDMRVGLKNALRQAPDCILIGEVRDRENMTRRSSTPSPDTSVSPRCTPTTATRDERIISFYRWRPARAAAGSLLDAQVVISQRLVKNVRGTQSARSNHAEQPLHGRADRKGEISEMKEAMEKALTPGSQTFEQSLSK